MSLPICLSVSLYCIFNSSCDTTSFLFPFIILFLVLKICIYLIDLNLYISNFHTCFLDCAPTSSYTCISVFHHLLICDLCTANSKISLTFVTTQDCQRRVILVSRFQSHKLPDFFFDADIFITQVPSGKRNYFICVFISCV